eukprot:TRINITY_DN19271_c0_g1_i1.p1 TRINITY_DN19271_c0_g1~~TRINITY_DN19271_c0_g1_i1.p1  ORF type:complete len:161 (-),score=26.40 TRINITY_DN19271_c0_g1_i1:39-521(-)
MVLDALLDHHDHASPAAADAWDHHFPLTEVQAVTMPSCGVGVLGRAGAARCHTDVAAFLADASPSVDGNGFWPPPPPPRAARAAATAFDSRHKIETVEDDDLAEVPFGTRFLVYVSGPLALASSCLAVSAGWMEIQCGWFLTQRAKLLREQLATGDVNSR